MPEASRVAIVTGAARGIGAAVALRLAYDGLAVAVLDLDEAAATVSADAITSAGGVAIALGADVADPTAVQASVDRTADELGAPTVLVNNAGITRDNLLITLTENDWDAVIDVHLKGAVLMTRAAQAHMVESGWGRIVNLSSTSALGNRGQANYVTAKAGVQGLTKTLALELGRFGITANCVAPGFIVSEMTRVTADRIGTPWAQYVHDRAQAIPVQRAGEVDDVANAVSFFADARSGFVSGQVLYVAGGPRT
ncbi:SDR family oxidoreductase [Pseudonocardia sp. N23]|uniref:SDR family oxidoreductase n=1 Tax=Pseudonocardia sp. N23 TaxID=1987376 RepID=UPI000BFB9F8C|nr:SDR family oxidoreductase [Pseudonocardia sp. N23]GAY07706.1 3-oxoacyl-[acyl-carrier protein] reductase [Pseudonocardia sp. N23]